MPVEAVEAAAASVSQHLLLIDRSAAIVAHWHLDS